MCGEVFGIFPEFWILKDYILKHSAKTTTTNCKFFKIKFLDLRLDYRLPRETPVIKLLTDSGQLSVQQKSAYHSILLVYKTLSTKELEYIFSKSVPEDETDNNKHTINTRRKQLEIIRIDNKLAVSRTSFFYRVSKLWNDLPLSTRKRKKLGSFKTKVKAWIRSNVRGGPK